MEVSIMSKVALISMKRLLPLSLAAISFLQPFTAFAKPCPEISGSIYDHDFKNFLSDYQALTGPNAASGNYTLSPLGKKIVYELGATANKEEALACIEKIFGHIVSAAKPYFASKYNIVVKEAPGATILESAPYLAEMTQNERSLPKFSKPTEFFVYAGPKSISLRNRLVGANLNDLTNTAIIGSTTIPASKISEIVLPIIPGSIPREEQKSTRSGRIYAALVETKDGSWIAIVNKQRKFLGTRANPDVGATIDVEEIVDKFKIETKTGKELDPFKALADQSLNLKVDGKSADYKALLLDTKAEYAWDGNDDAKVHTLKLAIPERSIPAKEIKFTNPTATYVAVTKDKKILTSDSVADLQKQIKNSGDPAPSIFISGGYKSAMEWLKAQPGKVSMGFFKTQELIHNILDLPPVLPQYCHPTLA